MKRFLGEARRASARVYQRQTNIPCHGSRMLLERSSWSSPCVSTFGGQCWYSSSTRLLQNNVRKGEGIYQQALQAMEKAKSIEREKEQEQSQQMYDAWQKSQEAEHSPKTQGVVVVKTLVKQARKEKARKVQDEANLMKEAMELLEQAANEHSHPMALVQLGNMTLQTASKAKAGSDSDSRENVLKAMDMFQRAGEAGSRVGWFNLGHLYWTGYPVLASDNEDEDESDQEPEVVAQQIVAPDLYEAMDAFTKAIDLGDSDAMYLVGVHRLTEGGRENLYSGLKLIELACDSAEHGGALYYLALLHLNGESKIGLEPCTQEEFAKLLDRAVEAGNVDAQFTRGHSYYHGTEGYAQNHKRALADFLQAADQGHADAAVSAGAMLHTGIGVPKDQRRAFEMYQAAGELGSKEGWQNVVACYTAGEGVPKSLETARYIAETMLEEK
jgi:TPR repeat protein